MSKLSRLVKTDSNEAVNTSFWLFHFLCIGAGLSPLPFVFLFCVLSVILNFISVEVFEQAEPMFQFLLFPSMHSTSTASPAG